VREALMKTFVPLNLGFQHISRNEILADHQTVIATELLTSGPDEIVLIADGTYLFCQKSSNNEFQRRTYSNHKHRHLVKPMIITASVSMIQNQRLKRGKELMNTTNSVHIHIRIESVDLLVFIN
jgi:hypothetical protein